MQYLVAKHRTTIVLVASLILLLLPVPLAAQPASQIAPIKVGWIGGMTGPTAKYGSFQSAQLAEEVINANGGINGQPLKLIYEDGKANGAAAVAAANKLINFDKLKFIVGGHCTPESLPISSIIEKSKVLMLAAITSSPKLSDAGDYVFRVTAVSTSGVDLLVPLADKNSPSKKYAIIYELTDYAEPLAQHFRHKIEALLGKVVHFEGYLPGTTDFRTLLLRAKANGADSLYLSVQAPESAQLIFQQMQDLDLHLKAYGNEITANSVLAAQGKENLFEGLIFAEPEFDLQNPETHQFVDQFKERFNVSELPFGIWSAEAYDAVVLLAATIAKCGDDVDAVKACLYRVKDYRGASGLISIDKNGDGQRKYVLKKVLNGTISPLQSN